MELLISCPLCSQPGFSDVNSLWLNLIRAATSQLNCPVCEEVLCGLDKLTIHLMSHSLRDQISSTCVPSNASFSSATSLRGLDSHIPHESAMVSPPVHQQPMKENSSIASYVVINFPPIRSVSMETSSQFLPSEFPNATQNEEPINVSSSLKPEHSVLSAVKAEAGNNFPARTMISQPPNLASTLPGNEDSDTPSSFKVRDGCAIGEKLHSKEFKQRVHKELKNHETSLSKGFSESESNEKFTCSTLKSGPTIRCQMCGLTLKDNNIALLHYQLVHNCSPHNDSEYQLPPTKNDEKETSFKQFPSRCKRESMASQSRDAANPLHRFPCHICNKVFRMRGSLMVHLRVAHTPSGTAGLTSRLENSSHSLTPKTKDDVSCKLSLQNLSLRDTNTTAAIGKELDIFGDVVGKINNQTQLGKNNCMVILEPSCSPVDDQTCSFVHQSGKKAIKPCSNKKSSSSAVNVSSPINSSLVVSATPMESLGVIFPCAHCNKTFAKEVLLTQHIKSHESKQWECDVCLKSFTTKYFLKKHKRLHTGEMPYTCGICSKSFTFQQSYHKHLLYHSDEKPHSCAECGRAFKELSTLHNHQRIHTGEKPWACETCGKCFRQRVSYLVHRRIHTGAMPYQCTVCLKSFRYKVSQRTHKCLAQQVNESMSSTSDLLHSLLQTPSKEQMKIDVLSTPLNGLLENSNDSKKEQMSILSKDVQTSSACFSSFQGCQSPSDRKTISLPCSNSGDALTNVEAVPQQSSDNNILNNITHTPNYSFASLASPSLGVGNALEINHLKSASDFSLEKGSLSQFDTDNTIPAHSSSTPAPSTTDFNIDLFQDILSLVMSPTPISAHSPSTQMRHLSLVEDQTEDDFESGLELRQLLYGPCDSESPP